MAQFPFRNPVYQTGDGDPPDNEEWTPPSYAKESEEEWKPPSYAKSAEEEQPKKPDIISRIKDALTPDKSAKNVDLSIAIPAQFKQFLEEHPNVRQAGQRFLSGQSPEDVERAKSQGITELAGPEMMKIPGTDKLRDVIRNKVTGTGNYWAGAAGSVLSDLVDMAGTGFDPRTAGEQTHVSAEAPKPEEPPVRRSMRTDLGRKPLVDETPQQTAVAIAQTRDDIPRTPKEISAETGIPQPSIRRTIGEIKRKTAIEPEAIPETPTVESKTNDVAEFLKSNPDAKMSDVEQFIDSVNNPKAEPVAKTEQAEAPIRQSTETPYRFQGDLPSVDAPEKAPAEPMNRNDVPREFALPEDAQVNAVEEKPKLRSTDDILYDIARNKHQMAESLPEDAPIRDKPNFVNPFEKAKIEEPSTEWKAPEYAQKAEDLTTGRTPDAATKNIQQAVRDGKITNEEALDQLEKTWKAPSYAEPIAGLPEGETELHGGLGGIKPSSRALNPNSGPYGAALDKLFQSMGDIKEKRVQQDVINRNEHGRRFAAFNSVKDEGATGAAQSLSKLKGEFDKVDFDKLKMTKPQVDSLFTGIKRAKITAGEKARGYTALFKILNGEGLPQRNELKILDDVFGNSFAAKMTEMHGGIGALGMKLSEAANTMKSMQNSLSLAAPLRHGIGLIGRKEFMPAFADMFKFYTNKEYYNQAMQALTERPNYLMGREAGLFTSQPGSLASSEEEFLKSYVGVIPGVRDVVGASQRGYSGFLNKLRSDVFDGMIKQAKSLGHDLGTEENPSNAVKGIAKFINNATGRGDLGALNKMTNELNTVLWSPRMIASRVNMLANPKIYMDLPKGMRQEGLKSLLGIAALGTTIDTLASLGGAKVTSNILSTDFGKSRFGKQVIDPWGGLQQYVVGAARFLAGKTDDTRPTSRLEIAGRFLANKESPAASLAHTLLTARKFTGKSDDPATAGNFTTQYGENTSIQRETLKRFTPIFVQDLQDLVEQQPNWSENVGLTAAMAGASLAGMAQEYPARNASKFMFKKPKPGTSLRR